MPAWSERREFRRYPIQLPLLHRPIAPSPSSAGVGWTRDVSRGGLLLRLPQVLPPGTALELTLPTPTGPLPVAGTVVWVAPPEARTPDLPIRHGLRFTALDWATALSLGRVLAEAT